MMVPLRVVIVSAFLLCAMLFVSGAMLFQLGRRAERGAMAELFLSLQQANASRKAIFRLVDVYDRELKACEAKLNGPLKGG